MPEENIRTRRTIDDPDMYDDEIDSVQISKLSFSGTTKPLPVVILSMDFEHAITNQDIWLTKLDILMLAKEIGITGEDFK